MTTIKSVFKNEDDDTVKPRAVRSPAQFNAAYILTLIQSGQVEGYSSGEQALAAWGAHSFKASEASDRHGISWLLFKVNAQRHQGWVRVSLKGIDTAKDEGVFSITLEKFNNISAEYGVERFEHNVRPAELASTIDKLVER